MVLYSHQQQHPNTDLVNYWVIQNRVFREFNFQNGLCGHCGRCGANELELSQGQWSHVLTNHMDPERYYRTKIPALIFIKESVYHHSNLC